MPAPLSAMMALMRSAARSVSLITCGLGRGCAHAVVPDSLYRLQASVGTAARLNIGDLRPEIEPISAGASQARASRSRMISKAALRPGRPVTPPPGWAPAPHR